MARARAHGRCTVIALGGIFLFLLGVLVGLALGVVADMKREQWKREAAKSRADRGEQS